MLLWKDISGQLGRARGKDEVCGTTCCQLLQSPHSHVIPQGASKVGIRARWYQADKFCRLRVENPSTSYDSLIEYFWNAQAPLPPPVSPSDSLATPDLPHMQITHPAGCFSQFLEFFGPKVFALWRLSLLKKRILIFSPPPVGVICYRGNVNYWVIVHQQ